MIRTLALSVGALLLACSNRPAEVRGELQQATSVHAAAGDATPERAPGATLIIASELRGYLAPCGCTENMRGGIARAAYQIDQARRGGGLVLFLDAGNSLFGASRIPEAKVAQDERKARALAEAFRLMKLDVRGVGVLDEARGEPFRESLTLPELLPGRWRLLDAGGRAVGVVAARTEAELVTGARAAREGGAIFVVGLYQQPLKAAQAAARNPELEADLLVISDASSELAGEENKLIRSQIPVVQVQNKGRSLAKVELTFGGTGDFELARTSSQVDREIYANSQRMEILKRQINDPRMSPQSRALRQAKLEELVARVHRLENEPPPATIGKNSFGVSFLALEAALPGLPAAKAILTRYDRDVGLLNLAWASKFGKDCPAPSEGKAGFVGNATCRACHAQAFAVYEASKHAQAWETLVSAAKQHHLDCVGCHVTGYEQPGGVCRIDKVAGREDVGCESCHGPGSLHAVAPSKANVVGKPSETDCVGCHNAENSPHFEFRAYLPKILGPGHGSAAQ